MTIELQPSAEPQLRMKRPLPNLLVQGFQLALRNWPCVLWTYAANLLFALLAGIPFSAGLAAYLDHSLAARNIAGTLDLSYLGELAIHLRGTGFFPMSVNAAGWLNLLHVLVLFVLFAGTVFVYVTAEPPRFSVLLRGGVAYFWRFVRAAIVAGFAAVLLLGFLMGIRALLLARAQAVYVERQMFIYSAMSAAVILLVALLLRLWWDLVEVYIVRNAMDGERRIHQALLPALLLLSRYFFRTFGSFLLTGAAGLAAFALCLLLWRLLPAQQIWVACLLAQVGLFLLLAARFWQRALEATLVMSADPPRITTEEMEPEETDTILEEELPTTAGAAYLAGLSEPTLRDLVLKLRTEPLAPPDVLPGPLPRPTLEHDPMPPLPAQTKDPSLSLLDRHESKFPLGRSGPETEVASTEHIEKPKIPDHPDKTPHSEKRPLP